MRAVLSRHSVNRHPAERFRHSPSDAVERIAADMDRLAQDLRSLRIKG